MSRPGEDRARPLEGLERYEDAIDKLFSYPTEGLSPEDAERIKRLEATYETVLRTMRDVLNPCADRSHSIRELRTSYLTACDAIRLGGAF